jgi:hypothetical protein
VVDRGGPDGSCSEWHGDGMAGEDDAARACRWWHQAQAMARPILVIWCSLPSLRSGAAGIGYGLRSGD